MTPRREPAATQPIPELPNLDPALKTEVLQLEPVILKPDSVSELTLVLEGVPGEHEPETVELFPSLFESRPLPTVSPPALSRGPGGRSLVFFSEPTSPSNQSGSMGTKPGPTGKLTKSTSFFVHFPSASVFQSQPREQLDFDGVRELILPPSGTNFVSIRQSLAIEPLLFYVRRGGSLSVLPEPARAANDSSPPRLSSDEENADFTRSSGEFDLPPVMNETTACNSV